MDMELLKRLYMACSDDNCIFTAGLNLSELYQRIEEVKSADQALSLAVDAANLPPSVFSNGIEDAFCESIIAYEMQGFVNGFRLAMRMATGKAV